RDPVSADRAEHGAGEAARGRPGELNGVRRKRRGGLALKYRAACTGCAGALAAIRKEWAMTRMGGLAAWFLGCLAVALLIVAALAVSEQTALADLPPGVQC